MTETAGIRTGLAMSRVPTPNLQFWLAKTLSIPIGGNVASFVALSFPHLLWVALIFASTAGVILLLWQFSQRSLNVIIYWATVFLINLTANLSVACLAYLSMFPLVLLDIILLLSFMISIAIWSAGGHFSISRINTVRTEILYWFSMFTVFSLLATLLPAYSTDL